MSQRARRSIPLHLPRAAQSRAKVAAGFTLLALVAAGPAAAQSGSVAGSALDPQSSNESLMPTGGFRLDGAPEPSAGDNHNAPLLPGAGGFGLQFYGSYNLEQQRQQAEPDATSAPAAVPQR